MSMTICKLLPVAMLLTGIATTVSAQQGKISAGMDVHVSAYDKAFAPMELGVDLGYNFTDRLKAGVRFEDAYAHVEADGAKFYEDNTTCGLFAAYDVLCAKPAIRLTLKAGGGTSLKDDAWKYNYYDGGIYLQKALKDARIFLGFGARYYDSRGESIGHKWRAYCAIGFSYSLF